MPHHHHHHRLLFLRSTPLPQLSPGGAAVSNTVTAAPAAAPAGGHELPTLLLFFALVLSFIFFVLGFLLRDIFRCFCHRHSINNLATKPPRGGIDPTVLSSFPIVPYNAVKTMCGPDCVVCLGEFDSETDPVQPFVRVRVITVCGHVFHVECIDIWLESHVTCPICRSDVRGTPDNAIVKAILDGQDDRERCGRRGSNEEGIDHGDLV